MKRKGNFKLFSNHVYYVPGVGGMFVLLAWLAVGAILANIVSLVCLYAFGLGASSELVTVISYPIMFLVPMIAANSLGWGRMNSRGVRIDNNHFAPVGGVLCALIVSVGTLACAFCAELAGTVLPPMPEFLETMLSSLTQGTLWVNLLCVSIFAPLCEEWLCRGMVLRGLLSNNVKPVWAVVISAAFFALIHLNPWQAIPAFLLGCLFGFVYYRTGSLKLTMLMHCVNNTFAVLMSRVDGLEDIDTWRDVLPANLYWIVFAACAMVVVLLVLAFRRIPLQSVKGNCEEVPSKFEE